MRFRLILAAGLGVLLGGGTCLPLLDTVTRDLPTGTVLATSVNTPSSTRTVPRGTEIEIEWALSNLTGQNAVVTILVEKRSGVERTTLAVIDIQATTALQTLTWDTSSFSSGDYAVVARAVAGAQTSESGSIGRIIVNEPTTFAFTAPTVDAVLASGGTLTLAWTGGDADGDGNLSIFLDPDTDHASGNEVEILRGRALPVEVTAESFEWDGTGTDGTGVPSGTYGIFARLDDSVNTPLTVEGLAQVTTPNAPPTITITEPSESVSIDAGESFTVKWVVQDAEDTPFVTILYDDDLVDDDITDETPAKLIVERQQDTDGTGEFVWDTTGVASGTYSIHARVDDGTNDLVFLPGLFSITIANAPPAVAFTAPADDTDFLNSDTDIEIVFTVEDADDVFLDLKIDPDADHANGNEIAIMLQRLIKPGSTDQTFAWDGSSPTGDIIGSGMYALFSVANDGVSERVITAAGGLILRRADANKVLIGLLQPAEPVTVDPGDFVTIVWRDNDPTGTALIRLTIDDDQFVDEAGETGAAQIVILNNRLAGDPDDNELLNQFDWQVPSLAPDTYYVFANISSGVANEHTSRAGGVIIVRDPASP